MQTILNALDGLIPGTGAPALLLALAMLPFVFAALLLRDRDGATVEEVREERRADLPL